MGVEVEYKGDRNVYGEVKKGRLSMRERCGCGCMSCRVRLVRLNVKWCLVIAFATIGEHFCFLFLMK